MPAIPSASRITTRQGRSGRRSRDVVGACDPGGEARGLAALRALVGGGLTFQLAADLVHTSIAPTWDDVGRLGAIALIRTFLNYFLERDMEEMQARQHAHGREPLGETKT